MTSLGLPTMPKLPKATKFWKKRSANISEYDPTFRVVYLGNVLTGWAKGDGCVDKPLATLWKNHSTTDKPNIMMKVTVCASGLKAVTKEHGLTEYWAHRITFCEAEPSYPKVFCWIYRHEGRKMKQELRCHAVLCPSENKARLMAKRLKEKLHQALIDFKKEKVWRQNARLSLANAGDEQKTMPFRKIMLQAGGSNYRPPLEKGKSAPKLRVIEEVIVEEDEESVEDEDEDTLTNSDNIVVQSKTAVARSTYEDTEHITRLRIGQDGDTSSMISAGSQYSSFLPTSDSMPLLAASVLASKLGSSSSRCPSSISMDQLSTMTAVTSFIDDTEDECESESGIACHNSGNDNSHRLNVQNLIVISNDPSPEVRRRRRSDTDIPSDGGDARHLLLPISNSSSDEDEDQVTDYLEKLSVSVEVGIGHPDSSPSTVNAASDHLSGSLSGPDSPGMSPQSPLIQSRLNNEQDTISDESGYSEESNPSAKEEILDFVEESKVDLDQDLTVTGVLISDFSPSERLKYLQRSQSTSRKNINASSTTENSSNGLQRPISPDFLQNKVPEFCINI